MTYAEVLPHKFRMTHTDKLLALLDLYCAATGRSEARVATLIQNAGHFFSAVRAGSGFTVRTYERALRWFSDNWPAGLAWPEGVERPAATVDAA